MSNRPDPSAADELLAPATLAALREAFTRPHDVSWVEMRQVVALIDRVEALTDLERYVRGRIPEGRSIAQHLLRLDELEAEVERLRAENEALNDFIQQRAQKCCENLKRDMRAELERLRAENAALIEAKFVSLVTPEELKRLRSDALTTVEANALRRSSLLSPVPARSPRQTKADRRAAAMSDIDMPSLFDNARMQADVALDLYAALAIKTRPGRWWRSKKDVGDFVALHAILRDRLRNARQP